MPSRPFAATSATCARAPRLDDAKAIAALINDRRVAENLSRVPHPYRLADAEEFIARANQAPSELNFLITTPDGDLLGGCGIGVRREPEPELGYWLGVPFWGNGYATEAARAVLDHAFADLGHATILGAARVSNPASRRVLEKCGFQWTGVGLYRVRALNSSAPVDRFRLDRGLWASLKTWGAGRAAWGDGSRASAVASCCCVRTAQQAHLLRLTSCLGRSAPLSFSAFCTTFVLKHGGHHSGDNLQAPVGSQSQ
jgi:RimJ/RimL family protein N-acetyltransferase